MSSLLLPQAALSRAEGLRYGLMGLPLAFVALPLYVVLPHHYAQNHGMPLALLGALLLGVRLFDAVIDPLIGRWSDRLYAHSLARALMVAAWAALLMSLAFVMLFNPLVSTPAHLLWWAGAALVLCYTSYSVLTVLHQAWGAMLGGDEAQRSRIVAWREGAALVGVVLASAAPTWIGMNGTAALLAIALGLGWWAWRSSPKPQGLAALSVAAPFWQPLTNPAFRRLLGVFMLNGTASAVPATLVLFFVQDQLQASAAMQPLFLGCYFVFAGLSFPFWLRLVPRWGLARSWMMGMLLAIAAFAWTFQLGAGDSVAFLVVCAITGVALGADLAFPAALLAGIVQRTGTRGQSEGNYFGWWNFATKLNLALAAGLTLPALQWWGYLPGSAQAGGHPALGFAYALLPCALKLIALAGLYWLVVVPTKEST